MKKIISVILLFFLLNGCVGYEKQYNEEAVKKDSAEYLEEKYGGSYEFSNISSPGGSSSYVEASFKDLDKSDEKGTVIIVVVWTDNNGAENDYERYYEKKLEYNEDFVKKDATIYLNNKYDFEYEFMWCISYSDYIGITFDVLDDTKQNTVTVKWYEDGTMTDSYEE